MEVFGTKGKRLPGDYIRKVETDSDGREWILTLRQRYDFITIIGGETLS